MAGQIPKQKETTGQSTGDQAEVPSARTLDEARHLPDFAVVLESDYGGTIFATCPVSSISCDEQTLSNLLDDIDEIFYALPEGRRIYFRRAPLGSRIEGGDGGGFIEDGVWCHPFVHEIGLCAPIENVFSGRAQRLVIPSVNELDDMANQDDAKAMFLLWRILRRSQPDQARRWCIKAARLGHIGAQFRLSLEKDLSAEDKAHWLMILSAQTVYDTRIKIARYRLALAYREGTGVERNATAEALLLSLTCNSRFHAGAAMRLARLYFDGVGVQKNRQLALTFAILGSVDDTRKPPYWSRIMSRDELTQSRAILEEIRAVLTNDEVEEAEALANKYFNQKPWTPLQAR